MTGTHEHLAHEGCAEERLLLSRRSMLGVTAGLFSTAFLPRFARANTDPDARLLVVILRGGMDGMGMLIPKLDPLYSSLRKQLAIPFASTLSLGSDFALHPSLPTLHQMFLNGEAAIAPASGLPVRNRSHFECQDNLENGLPANAPNSTGWLNRLLGTLPASDPIRVNRGIEIGEAPLILRGPEPVLGWSPTWFDKAHPGNVARLQQAYTAIDPELWGSLERGLAADSFAASTGANTTPSVNVLRKGFIGAARLMRAATGPRVAVLSIGGWDTHAQEGGLTGLFSTRLKELDQALADFKAELGPTWSKTVAACVTEFGRTVSMNGAAGTDHGIGTVSLLVGGAVKGGFIGDWPGLAPNQLLEGDLKPTVDLRAIFKGILRDHVGVAENVLNTSVFPASAAAPAIDNMIRTPALAVAAKAAPARPVSPQEASPIARYRRKYAAI